MKKTLAYKSTSEIIATIIILMISIIATFYILRYYNYEFSQIDRAIQVVLIVVILIVLVSVMQLLLLISKPDIMIEYDDDFIYYHFKKDNTKTIEFKKIQNIYTTTSIWTKPFVVYTAIVIVTQEETFYLRHMSKMNEAKEFIQNIAYYEEQK